MQLDEITQDEIRTAKAKLTEAYNGLSAAYTKAVRVKDGGGPDWTDRIVTLMESVDNLHRDMHEVVSTQIEAHRSIAHGS